jgi:hypothetical protein
MVTNDMVHYSNDASPLVLFSHGTAACGETDVKTTAYAGLVTCADCAPVAISALEQMASIFDMKEE